MSDTKTALAAWDRDHFFHPSTHMGTHARGETTGRVIVGGEGVYITDMNGRRSLDAFAGLYCVNVGYGRQQIADAIAEQAKQLAYYHAYVGHGTDASINLEEMIIAEGPHTVAAFIGEPILGTGGIVPPPEGYWPKIQAVLNKYDVLLVADEVITGFGRLGAMFGSDLYHIKPDLITIAKG